MPITTIWLHKNTVKKLFNLKHRHKLKSYEEVINLLLYQKGVKNERRKN